MPEERPDEVLPRRASAALLLVLLALGGALSVRDSARDSVTADEPWHLVAAVVQARAGTWIVSSENPPLAKELYGRAALLAGASTIPRIAFRSYFRSLQDYLFGLPGGSDPVVRAARLCAVASFLACLAAAFLAAGGARAGLLATALLLGDVAFFPHGHLATLDVPFALFTLLVAATLAGFVEKPTMWRGSACAAALAAALATKGTGVLLLVLVPGVLLVCALRDRAARRRFVGAAGAVPAGALLLLSGYLHLYLRHDPPGTSDILERIYRPSEADRSTAAAVSAIDPALGRYAAGVLFHLHNAREGQASYFLGTVSPHPSSAYHLVALVSKSPVVWLAALAIGSLAAMRARAPFRARLYLLLGAIVLFASLPGPRIGVRHVFPAVVLLTAGAAAALAPALRSRAALGAVLLLALSPLAFGRSLGWFGAAARLFPDPPVADSNLDWGQDLFRLRDELPARGISPGALDVVYFGGDLPATRIPGSRDVARDVGPPRRYLAVSRQLLLTGPDSALGDDRAAVADALRAPRGRFLFRAGDSIDVFERRPPGDPAPE